MTDEQYWDCDICEERYYESSGYTRIESKLSDADGEVLWLCKTCADVITKALTLLRKEQIT